MVAGDGHDDGGEDVPRTSEVCTAWLRRASPLVLGNRRGSGLENSKIDGRVGTRIVDQHKIGSEKNPTDTLVNNGSHQKQKLLR
jgi:hypothetical protein